MNLQQHNISDNNFEQCIKCTICTVYCPVAAVNPNYPGPKQAGPDGERLRLKKFNFYDEALKYCINCKRCEVACPSNVKIGDIIQAARIKYAEKKPKLRDFILANTDLVGTLSTPFAPIVNTALGLKPVKAILDGVMKIDHRRSFPKYAFGTFESWYKKVAEQQAAYPKQVSYFHGCYVNYNNPQLGKDLIKVMNAFSIGVQLLEHAAGCLDFLEKPEMLLEKKLIATLPCTFTIRDTHTCWTSTTRTCGWKNGIRPRTNIKLSFSKEIEQKSVLEAKRCPCWKRCIVHLFHLHVHDPGRVPTLAGHRQHGRARRSGISYPIHLPLVEPTENKPEFQKRTKNQSGLPHALSHGKVGLGLLFDRVIKINPEYRVNDTGFTMLWYRGHLRVQERELQNLSRYR